MDRLLSAAGIAMSLYGLYGMWSGSVLVKSGLGYERIHKADKPGSFWLSVWIYVLVGQLIFWSIRFHFSRS